MVVLPLLPKRTRCVARVMRSPLSMKRSLMFAVAVLVASLFVGGALKVQAATTSAPAPTAAVQPAGDVSTDGDVGYWASWADAASH
jgi:hypothetical protein